MSVMNTKLKPNPNLEKLLRESVGTPKFDRRGDYAGFVDGWFDNGAYCQNSAPYTPRDR